MCLVVVGGLDHFQWSKKLAVPLAPNFMKTDEWSCQLSPPPPPPPH